MSISLKITRIKASKHKSEEFRALFLYFPEKDSIEKLVYVVLRCKIHWVEDLRINLLIGNNIILSEKFVIDIK